MHLTTTGPARDALIDDVTGASSVDAVARPRRIGLLSLIAYVWVRTAYVLSSHPFVTPDTQSYRSGQMTRPPLGAALLSWLGSTQYVAVSALVSSLGFAALAHALWNPARRRWSLGVVTAIVVFSFLPSVIVYEHWLVPDSLLIGLSLLALAVAWRAAPARWQQVAMVALCLAMTATKEQGIGLVVLVCLVLAVRRCRRLALTALALSVLVFVTAVAPASSRHGTVIWHEPADTQMSMERFRVVIASLMWPDLSPAMAEVNTRAGECGMDMGQLILTTFNLTQHPVDFRNCPDLWTSVDKVSQFDVLLGHLGQPRHVPLTIERAFAPNMWAMSLWSKSPLTQTTVMTVDRWLDGAASVLPFAAIVLALRRRRGRRLAAVALLGTALALAAALVDASGQDRHAVGFRVVAFGIALMSLTVASTRRAAPADDLEIDDLEIDDLEIDDLAEFEADMRVDTGADLEPA